ncbi:MAG: sigma-70 family RNA polymerase sigma factor [Gemmatimonadetes bacterium]|nr:sigma-70 family RNA polymerase sigma factor [Gemmatimonadota bacterium]
MRFASRLNRDHSTAECLVQSTLLRAWRSRSQLRDPRALTGWLLQICRREHARLYDRKQLPTVDIDSLLPEQQPVVEGGDPVEFSEIRDAVFDLDDMYRVPLVLQVVEGWSTAEIASHLGVPRQTVLTRLFRARRLLRSGLQALSGFQGGKSRPVSAADRAPGLPSSPSRTARRSSRRGRASGAPG